MTFSQTVPTMQDTLLRVFVVALSLLMYPRDDPGVEEWDDNTIVGKQKHEKLLRRDELDHEMTPVIEEVTYTDNKGPRDDKNIDSKEQNQSYQHITKRDKMSLSDDATVTKQEGSIVHHKLTEGQHHLTNLDPSWPQDSKTEPEIAPKSSQTDHEQMREDIQADVSFRGPSKPQGQQNKPEEKEGFNSKEQVAPLSHLYFRTEKESSEKVITNWERDYLWYIWNTFSIISMMRLFRKYLGRTFQNKQQTGPFPVTYTAAEVPLPNSNTLQQFHSKCIQVLSDKKWWLDAFLEGFAIDLLDAMRTVSDQSGSVVIEDFQMVDACDIIVHFSPSDPYSFQCQLWNSQGSDLSDMQASGQVKLVENKVQNGCPCQSSNADDMVCLLHCETEKVKTKNANVRGCLCMKNSFVSKSQVTKWFQSTIKQAWALISHKYEFELNIRYIDAPGALVVRFRSGKKINFTMNPVVKFNTDAYFFIAPCSPSHLDTFWTLSLTKYEDRFLEYISKCLPENSCHSQTLEIAHFLYRKETELSGSSTLKDYHFKIALMHLLLTKDPSQWKPNCVACRLRDLLDFMEKSLERKLLCHVLIGNPLIQKVIELPAEFTQANPVNLFHPLVVHNCLYTSAVMHFQEILRNAHLLIHDYVGQCT